MTAERAACTCGLQAQTTAEQENPRRHRVDCAYRLWGEGTVARAELDEFVEMLRTARDRAHWLSVHRRMKLAGHVEDLLKVAYQMVVDLQGRHARKEPL